MKKWAFGIFIILAVLILSPDVISVVGVFSLIPSVIFSIYGLYTLNKSNKEILQKEGMTSEKDVLDIYKQRHNLLEEYKSFAQMCRKNVQKISAVYALGVIAVIFVLLFMSNLILIVIAIFFFTYTFNMLARYLRMQGKKAEWRDKLGNDEENRYYRKTIGDFGCYIVFVNSICAR